MLPLLRLRVHCLLMFSSFFCFHLITAYRNFDHDEVWMSKLLEIRGIASLFQF